MSGLCLQLARDVRCYHAAVLEEEGRVDVVVLASRLAYVGYDVTVRTALGEFCFRVLPGPLMHWTQAMQRSLLVAIYSVVLRGWHCLLRQIVGTQLRCSSAA